MSGFKENEMNIDRKRFYIFDCNNKMLGNPFGYKTHGAAQAQTSRRGGTVRSYIWHAFNKGKLADPNTSLVYSIKIGELV
jgi:hypothetical protein